MAQLTHTPKTAVTTSVMIALHLVLEASIPSTPEAEPRMTTTAQETAPMVHLTLEAQGTPRRRCAPAGAAPGCRRAGFGS